MRVLLTEGSGLTSRQCATVLAGAGHEVGVLSSDPLCLCRFTRCVKTIHRVPGFAVEPFAWLDAALEVYARGEFDVLLPTQEQVAVLAVAADRWERLGVRTAVPPFTSLVRVQDKVAAHATLEELGLPQPRSVVLNDPAELEAWREFPVYLKTPIGTASGGVRRLASWDELAKLPAEWWEATREGSLLAQLPVAGRFAMVQAVFFRGELVAFHANERVREGIRGGASHKRAIDVPGARELIGHLGERLEWHGALSADLILGDEGPAIIDINPRLVEPVNALRSGTDLVAALLEVATGTKPQPQPKPPSTTSARTHQLLLAVLGAAERERRRTVAAELWAAMRHRGSYRDSAEELMPRWRSDPRGAALLAGAATAVLVRPAARNWFAGGAVSAYALTPHAWSLIRDHAEGSARAEAA